MKLKKLLCLLLALSLVFCLWGCNKSDEDQEEDQSAQKSDGISPLLYKVTDDQGHTLWLFGSIHVGYADFYPLPDYVYDAFDRADAVAFEFDLRAFEKDTGAQLDSMTQLIYADGSTIDDHIDPDLYAQAVEILSEYDYYTSLYDYYTPVVWESLFSQLLVELSELDSELGVDYHLLDRAYEADQEILEVESAKFQYSMMANFSPELQEYLLKSCVDSFEDLDASKEELTQLVDFWASGDEEAFAAYLAAEDDDITDPEERKLYEEYNNAMIVERNVAMADFAEEALASGDQVFICVGAAHIVGEGAMADLLAQRGYTVTLVK